MIGRYIPLWYRFRFRAKGSGSFEPCGESHVESAVGFGRAQASSPSARAKRRRSRSRGWRIPIPHVIATACLVVVLTSFLVGALVWRPRSSSPPRVVAAMAGASERWDDQTGESRAGGVAILTRAVDVVWETGGPAPVVGSTVRQGVLRARIGFARPALERQNKIVAGSWRAERRDIPWVSLHDDDRMSPRRRQGRSSASAKSAVPGE